MDLIQRAAERMKNAGQGTLVERAAARLAEASLNPEGDVVAEQATPSDAATGTLPPAAVAELAQKLESTAVPEAAAADRRLVIDLARLQIAGFVTPTGSRTRISEEFRVIKRPLLLKAFAAGDERIEHGNLVMVTSAKPGEGKTFTAINLAMSLASERDLHVLLVDADVQRPSVFQVLGLPPQKGLLDLLSDGSLSPPDVLVRTNVRNLTLMAAGTPSLATTELLASHKMTKLMYDIASRYHDRIIIFDAPPVLASSEPSVLALHVGQIVLVVESGKTGRRAVEQTVNHISACPNINIVFNKAEAQSGTDEFGGYGYGYYESNE